MSYKISFTAIAALISLSAHSASAKTDKKSYLDIEGSIKAVKKSVTPERCLTRESGIAKFKNLSFVKIHFEDGSSKVILPFHSQYFKVCKATFCPTLRGKIGFLYLDRGQIKQGSASMAQYIFPTRSAWKEQQQGPSQKFTTSKVTLKSKENHDFKNALCSRGLKLIQNYKMEKPGTPFFSRKEFLSPQAPKVAY